MPLALLIERRYRAAAAAAEEDAEPRLLEVFDTIGSALRVSRHVRLFVAIGFTSFLTAAVCEFQYMTLFSAGRTEAQLTALFGRMYVAVSAFNLVFGLLFLNRLVLRLGVPNMALVQPAAFLVSFTFLLIAPGFEAAVLGFFVYQGLMAAITYDTHNLLLNAAPPTIKAHVRTFVDGLAEPSAVAVSGLFLLLGAQLLGSERISVIGVGLAAVYIILVLLMKSGYTAAMVQNLRRGWLDLANPPEHLLTRLSEGDLAFLKDVVAREDAAGARTAIGILWLNDKRAAVTALLAFLQRAGRGDRQAMHDLVAHALDDADPDVVGPVIEWVRAQDVRELGPALIEELGARGLVQGDQARALARSASADERGAGAVALMQGWTLDDGLEGAQIVRALLASDRGAAAGVRALGFSGHAQYAYTVAPFARHAQPDIRREAVSALRRLVSPEQHLLAADVLAAIANGTPDERLEAMDVLARIGDPSAIPPLLRVADRFTMLERRRAAAAILQFGSRSVPVLVTVLRDRTCPFAGRAIAARALGRLSLPQLDLLATPLIRDEIEHAYRGIWRWSLLERSASTPGMETLKRYYLDVRREVVDFVLQVLAVAGRLPNFELLSASLASDNRKERADAMETSSRG
jgi:HEAT repeat protein